MNHSSLFEVFTSFFASILYIINVIFFGCYCFLFKVNFNNGNGIEANFRVYL